ncbi:MAG: hypothetical protein K6T34_07890 [Thermoflavifilum sp.]|nr:hypothetical protein [Thermoflavifilum sp.]
MKKSIFILLTFSAFVAPALAQDRIFTYTYQSNVLTPKEREIEIWNTFHFRRENFYRAFQNKVEYETGIARNLQSAFYFIVNTSNGYNLNQDSSLSSSTSISFANEWKWKLSDPVANAIGSALYTEIELSKDEFEWENKIILDKKIGRNTMALNLVGTYENEKELEAKLLENEKVFKGEFDFGYAYFLGKGFNIGFELRNVNRIEHGNLEYSTFFAGPVFSYFREGFWINLTILPQIKAFKGATDNELELKHHEKIETRLMFSFAL